jgi:thiamine biosynthesis protein ThiC
MKIVLIQSGKAHVLRESPSKSVVLNGFANPGKALSFARYNFGWEKQFALSLGPETARSMHDETLPALSGELL